MDTSADSSDTVNSGRGLPGEFSGNSKSRVSVGAAVPAPGEVIEALTGEVSSPMAVETKFFNPGDMPPLGDAVK